MSEPSILVVEHEDQCPPGWLGEWLVEAGALLDVRRPYAGDSLPEDLTGHDGMVVLGGEMGAYDDVSHPWLTGVKQLAVAALDGPPVLGVCLGLQLLAVGLGGRVEVNPGGQQIGVLDVGWTPQADEDPLFSGFGAGGATPAVQWNNDVVAELPADAVVLARTGRGELQAARLGPRTWGVQWHPEVGAAIIEAWAAHDRDAAVERGVDLDRHVADVVAAEGRLRSTWRPLADRFVALCREHTAAGGTAVR